ncbi:4Fe-4S binding protein [Vibrio sp. SS-MA-C1-2]|uniref:4Fe-4S binding protein n=1 Tax=Vibrio sp. SS-MA-C1-2 TaxID=2908646 RepID=UPI001F28DD3A|nr:4Fe-4S binding protein [Vibrio sp. SS-MA-C1-2]UJF18539.1 4Fe-4S binding protein [Vibrio sp. SS-MA-C1-2]
MSFIESFTLMLALIYSAMLLYTSGKKFGAIFVFLMVLVAITTAFYWPLLFALIGAVIVMTAMYYCKKELIEAQQRPNFLRNLCQHSMALSFFFVALQYSLHTAMLAMNISPDFLRPDVVDAFLPIAAAIELKAIVTLGYWDPVHPAGAVMLLTVMVTGVLCKRAFCGWICPIGLVGEYIYNLRTKYFKHVIKIPRWLDWPLRSLKYLLLAFFTFISVGMPINNIPYYLKGNYHKIADIKTAWVFVDPGLITLSVLGIILGLTLLQKRAFCRYFCPYGALLGLISFASPLKIRRNKVHCLNEHGDLSCNKCTRACPSNIVIHTKDQIRTDECQACMSCISACPKKEALGFKTRNGWQVSSKSLMVIVLIIMFGLPLIAYTAGFWHSQTSNEVRMQLLQVMNYISH